MAIMFKTTMVPTKMELIAAWLPGQSWFEDDIETLTPVGAYRFDDPEGEVGMEGHLLTAGDGTVYHVPVTYRGAPLDDGDEFLIGTSEHGVHGKRWIYNAMGDPVYRMVLGTVISQGGTEAEEFTEHEDGSLTPREIRTRLYGSGTEGAPVPELWAANVTDEDGITYANTGFASLAIKRIATRAGDGPDDAQVLRATWPGQDTPQVIAILHTSGR